MIRIRHIIASILAARLIFIGLVAARELPAAASGFIIGGH